MKLISLFSIFLISASAFAQNTVSVESSFQSQGSLAKPPQIAWTNASVEDWAESVLRARVDVVAEAEGVVSGAAHFSYVPAPNVAAVALKQSSGGSDLSVTGAVNDFVDTEGRRIISLAPDRPLEIDMPFSVKYEHARSHQIFDVMVELEPTEYF